MHSARSGLGFIGKIHRLLLAMTVSLGFIAAPAGAQASAPAQSPASPASQALKIYQTFRDQDYAALFYLVAFTEKNRAGLTSADQFAIDVRKGYESGFKTPEEKASTDAILHSIANIMVGEAVVNGNFAAVPTSAHITINGRVFSFKGTAHLIQDRGVWKLDLTFDEDSEKAMAQRTSELLGAPEKTAP